MHKIKSNIDQWRLLMKTELVQKLKRRKNNDKHFQLKKKKRINSSNLTTPLRLNVAPDNNSISSNKERCRCRVIGTSIKPV